MKRIYIIYMCLVILFLSFFAGIMIAETTKGESSSPKEKSAYQIMVEGQKRIKEGVD